MFQVEARDPETRRPLRYPDQNGWDIIETRDFRDIARELLPMSDQPVDLELRRSGRPSATLRCRDRVRFTDVSTDHYEAVRIEIRGQEPVLLGPEDFYGGRFTPGFVEAKFRQLDLRVGRVVWSAWERSASPEGVPGRAGDPIPRVVGRWRGRPRGLRRPLFARSVTSCLWRRRDADISHSPSAWLGFARRWCFGE